jgi:hypothetical protein
MEKKNTLFRLSLEPSDAPLPKEIAAVPAAKDETLKRRLERRTTKKGEEKKPDDKPVAAQPAASADAGSKPAAVAAAPADAGTASAASKRQRLLGKMVEISWGRFEFTNQNDFAWTGCKVWQPPNLLYTFDADWTLKPGAADTVKKGAFAEKEGAPKDLNPNFPLVICKEGSGYMALR